MTKLINNRPVIILGMHRSGTTIITKLLRELGIYTGGVKENNEESVFFLKINEKILKLSNSSWNKPYDFKIDDNKHDEIIAWLKKELIDFKENRKYWGQCPPGKFCGWGWKDPRNTILINIWREIFPESKIIHIYRHPVDVAASLMNREKRFSKNGLLKWYFNVVKNYFKLGIYIKRAKELEDISKGLELWRFYVEKAIEIDNPVHHVKFEDFLNNPFGELKTILKFLDLHVDKAKIEKAIKEIDHSRKYAFFKNGHLRSIAEGIGNWDLVKKLNYDKIEQPENND